MFAMHVAANQELFKRHFFFGLNYQHDVTHVVEKPEKEVTVVCNVYKIIILQNILLVLTA